MNCLNTKTVIRGPMATHIPENGKEEELDLENLIMNSDDDDFNNSATSDESTTSLDNPMTSANSNGKPTANGKSFFKSLPMAVLSRKKLFGSHSDLSHQRASSPVMPVQLSSSIPQVGSASFKHVKSPLVERTSSKNNVSCQQMNWSVWVSDLNEYHEIELPFDATCNLLLQAVLSKLGRPTDMTNWSIVLQNSEYLLERIIEDHEMLVDLKKSWPVESITRLCLNRTPAKFEILQNPDTALPPGMLTLPPTNVPDSMESKQRRMQDVLLKRAPEFTGWLHTREPGARFWKKNFCVLRNSGLYCSVKGESKEPRHLQCFADVLSSYVWVSSEIKKYDSSSHCFCIKGRTSREMRWLSAESIREQRAWVNAIRLIINGNRFHESYVNASRRRGKDNLMARLKGSAPHFSSSESNLVAMDFSGDQGRVISDPSEVAMIQLEQQTSWRRRLIRSTMHSDCNGSSAPAHGGAWIARSIHQTQCWYVGKISREDAAEVLQRQGLIEGSYLVRDSQRVAHVISLCHNQKIRHIPISQMEIDGQLCYTINNGDTRFVDLIQLVDFHRLNKGSLPCRLQHEAVSNYSYCHK